MSKEIKTPLLNIEQIVDVIYDELLTNKSPIKSIKVWIKFYDKDNIMVSPYFYFKTKNWF